LAEKDEKTRLTQAARLFGVLAEPARLRILQLLRDDSMCGRDLARDLNLTPATTCHHLEKLKLANLLSERRSGRHVYYSISNSDLEHAVKQSLAALEDSPANEKKFGKKNEKHPAKNK
jgi:DNA-binding transcriptional ArsR family regulator